MELSLFSTLLLVTIFVVVVAIAFVKLFKEKLHQQEKRDIFRKRVGVGIDITKGFDESSGCWWCRIGRVLGSKNPKQLDILLTQLLSAGYREDRHIGAFYFIKFAVILAAFLVSFVLWIFNGTSPLLMIALPLVVMLVPERILVFLGEQRLSKINQNLPDFIDMTTICMNAGLSYMVSIKRVSTELSSMYPEICYEFDLMLDQIQVGVPKIEALQQFAKRNPTKDIQNLVQVLVQNEKLGSSISEALSNFSRNMYLEREQSMEEKAAKTSAKMAIVIMPFMLFPYMMLLLGEKLVMLSRGL